MAQIRFNPTAIAIQYDGNNLFEINELVTATGAKIIDGNLVNVHGNVGISSVGKSTGSGLQPGSYVVVFMGEATMLTEEQMRSAQGLV